MTHPNTPILVGGGQLTDRDSDELKQTPIKMMETACRLAAKDSGCDSVLSNVDTLAALRLTVDSVDPPTPMSGLFNNVPKSVANRLDIKPKRLYYTTPGGNTPQLLVNHFCEEIAQGKAKCVLLTGGEALHTMFARGAKGLDFDEWMEVVDGEPLSFGDPRPSCSDHELGYALDLPANAYPLFENALCANYKRTHTEHMASIGQLYARYTEVAANNPKSWFPIKRTAEELTSVNESNRMIAWPYPKLLNSIIQINQSAALILTSVSEAKKMGISEDRWIYLHGCADAHDHWNLSERVNYHSSPALREVGKQALAMANMSIDDIQHLDIYSCFPSAVQIACDELDIPQDDRRILTVTGGLPYFGGPGNNYSMHAIAEMMNTLRAAPGSFGLLNANGWYITKHSIGIYSTTPTTGEWQRPDPKTYQADILAQTTPNFVERPEGEARIETYTVVYDRAGASKAIIFGRLKGGDRFLATNEPQQDIFDVLTSDNMVGLAGRVHHREGINYFIPN